MPLINSYPACCGASIITGFGGTPDSPVRGQAVYNAKKGMYEHSKENIKAGDKLLKVIDNGYKNRLYTCILTGTQYKYWGKWLKANGFLFTNKFVNSVHNSILYHFVYIKRTDTCKVKNPLEPPKGWNEYPGPTPDDASSNDESIVPPSVVAVAA